MTTKVRQINWPDEFRELSRIEEQMICGICYEYLETAVMTPCSHNYCSLCIRKYLHYKTQCPACFQNVYEKDLYTNRAFDTIIQSYIKVREAITSLAKHRVILSASPVVQRTPSKSPAIVLEPLKTNTESPSHYGSQNSTLAPEPIEKCFSPNSSLYSPSTSKQSSSLPNIAKIFNTPKSKKDVPVNTDIKTVPCPVCAVEITELQINKHLDACLKREWELEASEPKRIFHKRPPLPKLVFRVMKESELKKKLKELGLPTHGDRKTLENRFTKYSSIYNAECDKINPRPIPELIKQCEQEETAERKIDSYFMTASSSGPVIRLQVDRNAKEEIIEEAQKKYLDAHKSSFEKLIVQVKNRKKKENRKVITDDVNTKFSPKIKSDNSDTEEITAYPSIADSSFQDSDSSDACPLQIYKSDDPRHFLNVNSKISKLSSKPLETPSNRPMRSARMKNSCEGNNVQKENKQTDNPSGIISDEHVKQNKLETSQKNIYNLDTDEESSEQENIPDSPDLSKKNSKKQVSKLSSAILKKTRKALTEEMLDPSLPATNINNTVNQEDIPNSSELSKKNSKRKVDKLSNTVLRKPQKTVVEEMLDSIPPAQNINNTLRSEIILQNENSDLDTKNNEQLIDEIPSKPSASLLKYPKHISNENITEENSSSQSSSIKNLLLNFDKTPKTNLNSRTRDNKSISPDFSLILDPRDAEVATSGKENNSNSANDEHAQLSIISQRSQRRRVRPKRYIDDDDAQLSTPTSNNSSSTSIVETTVDTLGPLKRRRGRSKAKEVDSSLEECQNPPKRSTRRKRTTNSNCP